MIRQCIYCHIEFAAYRKDKRYCSNSCKQMAFIKRKAGFSDFVVLKRQNVNPSIVKDETVNKNVKKIDVSTSDFTVQQRKYVPVVCQWVENLHWDIYISGNHENFRRLSACFKDKADLVKWISELATKSGTKS